MSWHDDARRKPREVEVALALDQLAQRIASASPDRKRRTRFSACTRAV
jgi:hypothetical protein